MREPQFHVSRIQSNHPKETHIGKDVAPYSFDSVDCNHIGKDAAPRVLL